MRLLIAEDNSALGAFLERGLEADGHEVTLVFDGDSAADAFVSQTPDLMILDLSLPRKDGIEVLRFIRSVNSETFVLVLTARTEIETRIHCLDLGADDCMSKPFSLQELRARCRALMRRRGGSGIVLRYADLEVNRVERSVARAGQPVLLTNKEFALLECLLLARGRSVSRTDLLERVWEMNPTAGTNVVDVYVNYLRRKLNDTTSNPLIRTIRGQGYSIGLNA
ncbi:response regulator transcription factor [Acidobacterium sp. S8]|uniref:response regulator transcription factor n=1 Tax=Acidobacterium sp. S8 TaxID=1641854 RepID=UPI00131ACB3F|nr:response regulator transcription factor [Acidobacterium sp. S8]